MITERFAADPEIHKSISKAKWRHYSHAASVGVNDSYELLRGEKKWYLELIKGSEISLVEKHKTRIFDRKI